MRYSWDGGGLRNPSVGGTQADGAPPLADYETWARVFGDIFEQLREKRRHYMELGKEIDFFIVPEPAFVYANPNEYANVGKPCAALISSDETWITFMKLRIDKVRLVELGQCAPEEALKSSRDIPDFSKPERWTAPYLQYSPGWWRSFVPEEAKDVVAVN